LTFLDENPIEIPGDSVQAHLESCASCSEFYREQLELNHLLSTGIPDLDPSPVLWQRIERAILAGEQRTTGRPLVEFLLGWIRIPAMRLVAATAVLLVILSAALFRFPADDVETELLAQLESYQLEVKENPFLDFSRTEGNPFETVRSQR